MALLQVQIALKLLVTDLAVLFFLNIYFMFYSLYKFYSREKVLNNNLAL